jgi:hypothetical protein
MQENTKSQASKDSNLKCMQEKTQTQARKESNAGKKRLKDRQEKT